MTAEPSCPGCWHPLHDRDRCRICLCRWRQGVDPTTIPEERRGPRSHYNEHGKVKRSWPTRKLARAETKAAARSSPPQILFEYQCAEPPDGCGEWHLSKWPPRDP